MKQLWIVIIAFFLCACDAGVPIHELPEYTYIPEEKVYEYTWLDDEVPADFDPSSDYLYLDFDFDGNTWTCRVNPYSLRSTLLCTDQLCSHLHEVSCPYYCSSFIYGDVVSDGENIFLLSNQHTVVDVYDHTADKMKKMDAPALGLNAYHIPSGKLTELVNHNDFFSNPFSIDIALSDGWIYYYSEAPVYDDGTEKKDEDGDTVTETRLFRIRSDGKGSAEDLGLYMGYTELIVRDGYIWNYYGFFNESPFWENVGNDDVVRTDLCNRNPVVIPCYEKAVDDPGGYWLPYEGAMFLVYTGEKAETHIIRSNDAILYYDSGFIWTKEILEEQWEERGVIKGRQVGVVVAKKDMMSGDTEIIENPPVPEDALYIDVAAVVDGRYVIYTSYDVHPEAGGAFAKLYYLRLDTASGDVLPIYP
ncbi:MAG: hypothetical protein IJC71_02460 [Clostridia bacterium]|nr:hypothetical protein [Clostridia bacterium]